MSLGAARLQQSEIVTAPLPRLAPAEPFSGIEPHLTGLAHPLSQSEWEAASVALGNPADDTGAKHLKNQWQTFSSTEQRALYAEASCRVNVSPHRHDSHDLHSSRTVTIGLTNGWLPPARYQGDNRETTAKRFIAGRGLPIYPWMGSALRFKRHATVRRWEQ